MSCSRQTRGATVLFSIVASLSASLAAGACGLDEFPRAPRSLGQPAPGAGGETGGAGGPTPGRGSGGATGAAPGSGGSGGPSDTATVDMGPGVTIAGRFVPRSKVIVFLHIGHSNMAGRATRPTDLRGFFYDPHPQAFTYQSGGRWQPAREPTAPDDGTGDMAGPGMALLKTAAMSASADTLFVSIGHGHSGTYGGYCASFRKGALLYDIVMKSARELVGKVTFGGIFTMLGQSEYRFPPERQEMLAACLQGIAAEMRGDLADPEIPFIVGDYEAGISRADIAPGGAHATRITAQLRMIPNQVMRAAVVPTDGLPMQDTHHYDMAGHKEWAARAIAILRDRKWARWSP